MADFIHCAFLKDDADVDRRTLSPWHEKCYCVLEFDLIIIFVIYSIFYFIELCQLEFQCSVIQIVMIKENLDIKSFADKRARGNNETFI